MTESYQHLTNPEDRERTFEKAHHHFLSRDVQVINDNLDYKQQRYSLNLSKAKLYFVLSQKLGAYLKQSDLLKRGSDYHTVAVIGAQSSGKSTLLNLLFGTKFEILDAQKYGRTQITKGVWLSKNQDDSVLVFDLEGTDSKERGEQRLIQTFEQTTSLFALAIADVVLINLWTTDIGRYGASNLGLLRVIFEVNMKIFRSQQTEKKLLLFILRDFDEETNNTQVIKDIISQDIMNIWKEIYKPDASLEDSSPHDFFHFDFVMLPHMVYQEEQFLQETDKLRDRFKTDSNESFFRQHGKVSLFRDFEREDIQTKVPIDGLALYIEKTWETIRAQKELNLPDQRIMVATLRCNDIKEEAYGKVEDQIHELRNRGEEHRIDTFADQCRVILMLATNYYDESAKGYDRSIYEKVRNELVYQMIIQQQLFLAFENQLKIIRQLVFQRFERDLRLLLRGSDTVNEQFHFVTEKLFMEHTIMFNRMTGELLIEETGEEWREHCYTHESDLNRQMHTLISHAREKEMAKLQSITLQAAKDACEPIINEPIYEMNPEFWEEIRGPLMAEIQQLTREFSILCIFLFMNQSQVS